MTDTDLRGLHMDLLRGPYGINHLNAFRDVHKVTVVGTVDHRYPADLSTRVVTPLPERSRVFAPTDAAPAAVFMYRNMGDQVLVTVEPLADHDDTQGTPYMAGGTYADTSDFRLRELVGFYGAVAVHDRSEPWALYNAMD